MASFYSSARRQDRTPRVLIVEDEAFSRAQLAHMVAGFGHQWVAVASGEEALDILDRSFDVVLLDVLMPGLDGYETLKTIRGLPEVKDIPVIMVTSLDDLATELRAVELGANDYVTKPVRHLDLRLRLANWIRMKAMADENYDIRRHLEGVVLELQRAQAHVRDLLQERSARLVQTQEQLKKEQSSLQEIRLQLRLLDTVLLHSLQGIIITDAQGTIVRVNPAFTAITGYSAEEALGQNPRILKSHVHPPEFYADMWRALRETGFWTGEIWNRKKNGEVYPERLIITAFTDNQGQVSHYVAIFHDISEYKRQEERLRFQEFHDLLTGLPNRALFLDRARKKLSAGRPVAVFFVDVDNFLHVNESLGYTAGDEALRVVAKRLVATIGPEHTVARLAGDEFGVLVEGLSRPEDALPLGERLLQAFQKSIVVAGEEVVLTASVGVALAPQDATEAEILLGRAEMAMLRIKKSGKNQLMFFDPDLAERAGSRLKREMDVRRGMDAGEFLMYYQPKIRLADGMIAGFEALVRWRRPDGAMVPPGEFIPLCEETGLIVDLGAHILRLVCQDMGIMARHLPTALPVAFNVSAVQFDHPQFVETLEQTVAAFGVPPHLLEVEITETSIMRDFAQALARLERLASLGFRLHLDDFGTGYASLGYLKQLPIHVLKIDQSFMRGIPGDPKDERLVRTIIDLGRNFSLTVLAEGVETAGQVAFLRTGGCDEAQGYFFARPMPLEEALAFVRSCPTCLLAEAESASLGDG
ncbi:MAG: Response regulator receiver modulated diguanylate cyclase/phosphodiesterase with sensor(S) [Desulfomicrobiaceae bacterium]|nr:Response regulator receiver modulated diguanylate cyclase/phosphodiesterase with sensor(S) [Desulfomicrobiaceae bacterium]